MDERWLRECNAEAKIGYIKNSMKININGTLPNSSKSKTFTESLYYAQVRVVFDKRDCTCMVSREIDVSFVNYDHSFEVFIV